MLLMKSRYVERRGTAAVQLAVCLPFLLTVMLGLWEVGCMVQAQNLIANGAREGGRQAAAGMLSKDTIIQNVVDYMTTNGLTGVTTSNVTLVNKTSSSRNDPRTAHQLDEFQVTVTVPYSIIAYSTVAQITPTTVLTVSTTWYSMLDNPCTIDTSIPSN
jgi:Flp pilus assembly protein TadG